MAVPLDGYLKGLAALVCAAFALIVLAGGPRRASNAFLAGFLLLIAGNQAMETMRALAGRDVEALTFWFRLATVAAALDPLFLYYFASIHPERNSLNGTARVGLVATLSAAFALFAVVVAPLEIGGPASVAALSALSLFTALTYLVVLGHVLRAASAPAPHAAMRALAAAMGFAAIPLVPRVAGQAFVLATPGLSGLEAVVGRTLLAVAVTGATLALLLRWLASRPGGRQVSRALLWAAVGIALLPNAAELLQGLGIAGRLPADLNATWGVLGRAATPLRWLLFGAFVSAAVLRHEMLGLPLAQRRLGARVFLGLLFLVGAALALLLLHAATSTEPLGSLGLELVALAAALLLSQGFRTLVARAAHRVYGVPVPGDAGGSHAAYRAAALQALAEGRVPETDLALARLRSDLGLDAATARVLEGLAAQGAAWPLEPGRLVEGRYRVRGLLGAGGAGRAFLARDERLQRDVVLKEVADDKAALQEAQLAGSLQHPHVVTVYDVVPRPGTSLIVTEHLSGGSLADRAAKRPLPFEEAARAVEEVLDGLAAVHARDIVHRDVKAANVLVASDGSVKLADFGIARARLGTTRGWEQPGALGTPLHMAPEQRRGDAVSPATDVYLVARMAQAWMGPDAPAACLAVLEKAAREAPAERYAGAAEMLAAWRKAREAGHAAR